MKGEVASARAISRSCGTSLAGHIEQLSATVTASGGRIVVGDEWPVTVAALNVALKPNEPISASASATVAGETLEVLVDGVDRVGAGRVGRRRQDVGVTGRADDVGGVTAAGPLGVIGMDRAAGFSK